MNGCSLQKNTNYQQSYSVSKAQYPSVI